MHDWVDLPDGWQLRRVPTHAAGTRIVGYAFADLGRIDEAARVLDEIRSAALGRAVAAALLLGDHASLTPLANRLARLRSA
jgi:hypothetical protein